MKHSRISNSKKSVLFVGLAHTASDSRLSRFLAAAIRGRFPDVECLYLGKDSVDPARFSNEHMRVIEMPHGINPLKRYFRPHDIQRLATHIRKHNVDLVQISDVRELTLGYLLKKNTSIPVIYDAHEDYFNQQYEYSQKSFSGLVRGVVARSREILHLRYMDAVFCTDDFLEQLYRAPAFASKSVTMVRNIPPYTMIRSRPIFHPRDALKLVYIGSINQLRGIKEAAEYCKRFNLEPDGVRQNLTVSFHVFAKPCAMLDNLIRKQLVTYHGYVSGKALEKALEAFDVGVSLLLPLKKFERNIPIKNFEYMAMGLPILTSNFGTMKRYTEAARAGVMIDPTDYTAFRDALPSLKDRDFRKNCGENGIAYAREHFRRDVEVAPYLDTVGKLLGLQ